MIKLQKLSKTYINKKNNKVKALDNINLSIEDKGMIFILGKSGSGKSTLLNILGGLDKFDEGDVSIFGNSMQQFKPEDYNNYRNTYVGFIFQDYNLIEDYTVEKNLALP